MAVANFHYITRMNSGFKVYILEGQPSLRTEDRHRQVPNERARLPLVLPTKRKRSVDHGLPGQLRPGKTSRLPFVLASEERLPFKNVTCSLQRKSSLSPPRSLPPSPQNSIVTTTTWSPSQSPSHRLSSPTHSPTDQWQSPSFDSPPMDEPLALIKKPRRAEGPEVDARSKGKLGGQVQMRPSVITCVSRSSSAHKLPDAKHRSSPAVTSPMAYDHVVEEHFRRSLGVDYNKASPHRISVSVSVDDHFAKALGEKWLQIKASSSSSSSSSSPLSSPSFSSSGASSPCSPCKGPEGGSEAGSEGTPPLSSTIK
ncbi:vestigial like 4 like [Paramormyrops kingsleyae]|uniref:Vestigial like 4 like n=1 Tax=Paramormyrops kingsleyae TaxID=1676925 RepID=A0A3B3RJK1_9TELE|nr:transcription cofactor vestigial-like protein 4 [Paramormyrops kingsleyae]